MGDMMGFLARTLRLGGVKGSALGLADEPVQARAGPIGFADLSEMPDPSVIPPLDRPDVDEASLTPERLAWRRDGVVILRKFLPDAVLEPYIERRERLKTEFPEEYLGGWSSPTPYEHVSELRTAGLYPPLMDMLEHLVGEPMMMHLNLTGWVSTERNWHQDDYLNPDFVNSWYAAAWIALDDIHPDSGPFQYIPGSHAWPLLRREKVLACMTDEQRNRRDALGVSVWPKTSESFVVPAVEAEIERRGVPAESFIASKGDVLIWHGRLMHKGSSPNSRDLLRRSLIVHYSGVNHRQDMPNRAQDDNGNTYAVFDMPLR